MNVVRKHFSFSIAMNKSTVIKWHNVTGLALLVKILGPGLDLFCNFYDLGFGRYSISPLMKYLFRIRDSRPCAVL